ncbi:MAG: DUF502 domain-containing protein [Alphaproteobacteria bacterium]|nr:DUF502 domain-containing protein [Alphaproteobacteria bacterium]
MFFSKEKTTKKASLKTYFLTGVLVTAPIAITGYLAYVLLTYIDSWVSRILPPAYNPGNYLPFSVPGLGVLLLVFFFILIGMLTAGLFGRLFVRFGELLISKTPFISGFYGAIKKLLETLLSPDTNTAFRKAVLVEYPRKGLWTIAFITGDVYSSLAEKINQKEGKDERVSIYVPTTPNPTSGFLIFVKTSDLILLDMKVEDAFKLLISTGIVTPGKKKIKKK